MIAPTTEAGQLVASRGWGVTSEWLADEVTLVTFAGEFIGGTSGSCALRQGNIGVFVGRSLKAILYTKHETDELVGELAALDEGFRLWSGEFLPLPVADISVHYGVVTVNAVAAEDRPCNGAAVVPNVYGRPITEARTRLISEGWEPMPQQKEEFSQQIALHDLGIVETIGCSGTGFGFCSYAYHGAFGDLTVTTAGELYEDSVPEVVGYAVECRS